MEKVMLYFVFTSVKVVLYYSPGFGVLHEDIAHSGVDSGWLFAVAEKMFFAGKRFDGITGDGFLHGRPGRFGPITSPSAPTIRGPTIPTLLFLEATICHSLSRLLLGSWIV